MVVNTLDDEEDVEAAKRKRAFVESVLFGEGSARGEANQAAFKTKCLERCEQIRNLVRQQRRTVLKPLSQPEMPGTDVGK